MAAGLASRVLSLWRVSSSKQLRRGRALNARFLNVDLDIESSLPLKSLERELGKRVVVMYSGRIGRRHCLFLESAAEHRSPDATINELAGLIEGLSPAGRRLWDRAIRREFDIGYETRFKLSHFNRFTLRPGTLRRIAALGATVAVTVYREDERAAGAELLKSR